MSNLTPGRQGVVMYNIQPRTWRLDIAAKRLEMRLQPLLEEMTEGLPSSIKEDLELVLTNYSVLVTSTSGVEPLVDIDPSSEWARFLNWFCGDRRDEGKAFNQYIDLPQLIQNDWINSYKEGVKHVVAAAQKHGDLLTNGEAEQLLQDSPLPPNAATVSGG